MKNNNIPATLAKEQLKNFKDIELFAINMLKNFHKASGTQNWKSKDKWWYLSQLTIAMRELETAMVKNKKNLSLESAKVANLALIINYLH